MSTSTRSDAIITITHVTVRCVRSYREVLQALMSLPPLDPELVGMLADGDADAVARRRANGPSLWRFGVRDHGSLLAVDGAARLATQFEIGNPLTAERMTRRRLAAGLYAPLRILVYEDSSGTATIEYDLPSSLLGQWGDEVVTSVARELDGEIWRILSDAAG